MEKKIISISFMLLLLGIVVVSSCTGRRGTGASKITFDSIVVTTNIPLLQQNDTTLPYADVKVGFTYPVKFRDKESVAQLQKIFIGTFFGDSLLDTLTPQEAVDQYINNYTEFYRSLSNSFYEDKGRLEGKMPSWYWYMMHNKNKILFQDDALLCSAVEYSDYQGGAHGSYRITYTNIDLDKLVTITEEDLFIPNYYKPLTEKIIGALMKNYAVTEPDSLLQQGFFTLEDIVPNSNFWLNDEGIHYSYNQYEIAPYAMGVIDVSIPYSELKDILLPESIVSKHYINK